MPPSLCSLEKEVLRQIQRLEISRPRFIVAVSGGLDSMVLLRVLHRLKPLVKFDALCVAHVHHGRSSNAHIQKYRNEAYHLVKTQAQELSFKFQSNYPDEEPTIEKQNEASFRKYRYETLGRWFKTGGYHFVVLAHHLDDLLETRLIRLIRGTGRAGLLAMAESRHRRKENLSTFRPLLSSSKKSLVQYATQRNVPYIDDPSNQDSDLAFRNWLRQNWLGPIEEKWPGSNLRLSQSLNRLLSELERSDWELDKKQVILEGLPRDFWRQIGSKTKESLLSWYLRALGVVSQQNQILEIIKRLACEQKNYDFIQLDLVWSVSERWIKARSLPS